MTSVNGADLASRTRKDYRTPCGPLGADVIVPQTIAGYGGSSSARKSGRPPCESRRNVARV